VTLTEIYQAQLSLVRQLLDQLDIDSRNLDYCSFQFDRAAADLATMHTALAEGWDLDRYIRVSVQRSIDQQSTRELDVRWVSQ
jgi:hypothetical protein